MDLQQMQVSHDCRPQFGRQLTSFAQPEVCQRWACLMLSCTLCRARRQHCASDPTASGGYDHFHNAWPQAPAAEPSSNEQQGLDGEAWLLPCGLSTSAGLQELQKLGMTAVPGLQPFSQYSSHCECSMTISNDDGVNNNAIPQPTSVPFPERSIAHEGSTFWCRAVHIYTNALQISLDMHQSDALHKALCHCVLFCNKWHPDAYPMNCNTLLLGPLFTHTAHAEDRHLPRSANPKIFKDWLL